MTFEECVSLHGPERITRDVICTRNVVGGTDIGSPLVSNVQLIGIASWSVPCATGRPVSFL